MAEVAVPFGAGTGTALTTLQQFRDKVRPTQPDMIDAGYPSTSLAVSISGTSILVQNGSAIVQGFRYDLTGGPLVLAPAAAGAANIFGVVCLTYDSAHSPAVYGRIISGTSGGALTTATLTNSLTGVWDFPLAHFERQPGGALVNLRDRRKFSDGEGSVVGPDDLVNGTLNAGWFPPAPRPGQQMRFLPSGNQYIWSGSVWVAGQVSSVSVVSNLNGTAQTSIGNTAFGPGSPNCSVTMVAPPSGQVLVTITCRGSSDTLGQSIVFSYECRVGSSSGSIVLASTDARSTQHPDHGPGYGGDLQSYFHLQTGLTPGVKYYFRTMQRTSSASDLGDIGKRQIIVEAIK
jgi:hypothetical protein